ncbi:MAG: hypothetical protein ABSH56_08565 [Bryobacteraceae bacterium]
MKNLQTTIKTPWIFRDYWLRAAISKALPPEPPCNATKKAR